MKKVLLVFTIIASLLSCKKEEEESNSSSSGGNSGSQCNCGIISDDGIDSETDCYWLEIRNECSGNKKKFCFDQDIWMNNYVGNRLCVSNVTSW